MIEETLRILYNVMQDEYTPRVKTILLTEHSLVLNVERPELWVIALAPYPALDGKVVLNGARL